MKHFDYAILGAGVAGLVLARNLLDGLQGSYVGLGRPSVLLADPSPELQATRTLAYWSDRPTLLDPWVLRRWRQVRIIDAEGHPRDLPLAGTAYTAVAWADARRDLLAALDADARVQVVTEAATELRDGPFAAQVKVGDQWATANFVFDSRPMARSAPASMTDARPHGHLMQVFQGAWVWGSTAHLDDNPATLMDFTGQEGPDLRFAYVLPISHRAAMVMSVAVGVAPDPPDPRPAIRRTLGQDNWEDLGQEQGRTALLPVPTARRAGQRILNIGCRGGLTRATTGYAVTRILADATAIVNSMSTRGHPFAIPTDPLRDRVLDAIWLRTLADHGAGLAPALARLFERAPVESVLRFLDGGAPASDLIKVIVALPPRPFLASAAQLATRR